MFSRFMPGSSPCRFREALVYMLARAARATVLNRTVLNRTVLKRRPLAVRVGGCQNVVVGFSGAVVCVTMSVTFLQLTKVTCARQRTAIFKQTKR